jgi:DMSO reductase anchor subunit
MSVPLAETFILGGALLIIVVAELLTGLLLRDYGITDTTLLLAAGLVGAVYIRRKQPATVWPIAYPVVLVVLCAALVVIGLDRLIGDVLTYRSITFGSLVGRIAFYGGIAAASFGAYQIWWQRRQLR